MTGLPSEADLRSRFDVIETVLALAGRQMRLLHPRSADDLLDEEAFDRDGRIPYWADVWPSSRMLAAWLLEQNGHGRRLLELGCGSGCPAVAAAWAGFEVLATDYYPEALEFTRLNALRNAASSVEVQLVDWRSYPSELVNFDRVIAADVLYEREYADMLAAAFDQSLTATGIALVADPGRAHAAALPEACSRRGLELVGRWQEEFIAPQRRCQIDFYQFARRRLA